jgi:probable HAF family extracellular repeat protein
MLPSLRRLSLLLLTGTAFASAWAGAARADATLTLLDLAGGLGADEVNGVSDNGTNIGSIFFSVPGRVGAVWTASGTEHSIASGTADRVIPNAISSDGSTVVGTWTDATATRGFVYDLGTDQTSYLSQLSANNTEAYGVNGDGSIIVGYSADNNNVLQAVQWSGPAVSISTLGSLIPNGWSDAFAVSDDGSVVAGQALASDGMGHMVYWSNSQAPVDLGTPNEDSLARAVSADGSTIVGYRQQGSNTYAISRTGPGFGTQTDLGSLGGTQAVAEGVSGDGAVIVGQSGIGNSAYHAFRYANGVMSDLNTLLTNAGINLGSTVLTDASAISANGLYIAADDDSLSQPYLVYYDGNLGALATAADQQASVDGLGKQRQAVAIQHDAYAGILTGDLDRQDDSNQVGILGLYGSAVGGVRGHAGLGKGWSLSGGVADGTSEFGGAGIGNGLYGAVALRYDAQDFAAGGFHPFGQLGGSFGLLNNVSMTRNYVGGTGLGTTNGSVGALYARLGVTRDFEAGDQVSFAGELGERWLSTDAYAEAFSTSNPFPAAVAAGTDSQTVAKLSASWTHPLSDRLEVTLRAAVGTTLAGSSGLQVATTGFGTLGTGIDHATWAELGAHASWAISDHAALDLYATGIFGQTTGASAHIGAGYHYKF